MFGSFGLTELLIILGVVLLLFGARRIPEIGKALGQTIVSFRNELRGESRSETEVSHQSRDEVRQLESGVRTNDSYKQRSRVGEE